MLVVLRENVVYGGENGECTRENFEREVFIYI
jgi:hypothetical protein